ncbi:flocculation protein FLO11-like isoform X2 [Siniperca chuatsi]|uniref:flocculation protein FLO11-like isoform X2 n=1 Tax=Siniperca chuatsi TaxID=119488 RepID=UPI001CE069D5|nr:flocculation protein FLO11-like isoform X2 [Siniperca chuatsi]
MELPLGGPVLRHYTQSRPRPHRQKLNYRPSRLQETIIESDNEVLELMGRVDEGVEEFFTKRVLPTDTLKKQDEESITVHEVAPASSVPCPPPTKTLRRKLGDFFTLKKRRGLKSETSHEGRPKKASIADLIRPLREVARAEKEKDKDRVKEHDKENEKEKAKEHPSAVTGESAVQETPVSGAPPLRGEAVPPRRALREGKSQSLILLSGSAAAGTTNARNTAKKQFEGQHSFEQKLHLMLQRIGVSKAQPGETQNQEGEMKKAESEGTIIDSKPEPPPTFTKPRTMSASSDTRHQIRPSVSAHESAGKPALLPKPVIKPGPPPTTSGRNTPENELAQIQEGETPTKLSPTAAPSVPAAPALTATTTPTVPTISNSVPDSTNFMISPSSTVPPSDTDICTDSVNPTAAATSPTNVTELNSKPSIPETNATTTELPTATFPTTLTSITTPTEPPAIVSVTSSSSESITQSLSVTFNSTTITTPSITTSETVSAPNNESLVSTASTNLSTKSAFPEPNGILSVDAAPVAGGGGDAAAISAITTASFSPSTSTSDMPSGLSTTTNSVTEASDDSTSVTSACSVTSVSSVTKTTSPPPNSSDIITTPVSPDAPITTLSSSALPPISSTSSTTSTTTTTTTTSPTSTDCMNSISSSTITHPGTSSSADISAPSTSSSETNPTDTTTTATSLNHAATTSTTSSATTAAISSPLLTDSDPPYTNNDDTSLTPTISGLPATDNSSATSHHLTSPAPSNDSPGQDNDLQTSPEERSSVEPAEKGTHEKFEMVQKSKQTVMNESKKDVDGGKESESENEKPALVNSEVIKEERVKPEEDTVKTEVGMAEPASGKDGGLHGDEGVIEGQKQDETKSVGEK